MKPNRNSRNRRPASRSCAWLAAIAFACTAHAPGAFADDAEQRVKTYDEFVARADKAWNAQDFAGARAAYEQAYRTHPEPTLLFNIASTYRRENNAKKALEYYEIYLRLAPAGDGFRAQAEETAARLRAEIAAGQNAKPLVALDSRPPERDVGLHKLQWAGIATGSAGLALLGYGIFQGNRAGNLSNDLESIAPGQAWTPELQAKYNDGQSAERQAIVFSVIGTAAIATGGALYYLGHRRANQERERERVTLVPVAAADVAGAMVVGHF
jgi:hypothetical protein